MAISKRFWSIAEVITVVAVIGALVVPAAADSGASAAPSETPLCRAWGAEPGDTVTFDEEFTVAIGELERTGADCDTGSVVMSDASVSFGQSGLRGSNLEIRLVEDRVELSDGVFTVPESIADTNFEFDPAADDGVGLAVANESGGLDFQSGSLIPTAREPETGTDEELPVDDVEPGPPVFESPQDVPGYVGGQDGNGVANPELPTEPNATTTSTTVPEATTTPETTTTTADEPAPGSEAAAGEVDLPELELISATAPQAPTQSPPDVAPGDILPAFILAMMTGQVTLGLDLNDAGWYLRLRYKNEFRVYGIIRWDGSYRFNVALTNFQPDPSLPARINATGTISGPNLNVPPIVDITGTLAGGLELAPNLTVTDATVHITNSGLSFGGNAVFACDSGQLDFAVNGEYADDKNWNAALTGGSSQACVLADGLNLSATTVSGSVSSVGGVISGGLDLTATANTPALPEGLRDWDISLSADVASNANGQVTLSGDVSLVGPLASFAGQLASDGSISLIGTAQIQGPAGDVSVSGTITGNINSPDVALTGAFRAGFPAEDIKVSEVSTGLALRDLTDDPGVVASHSKTAAPYTAGLAIDNDPSTFEATASNGSFSWFEVDLGAERYIDSVDLTPRPGTTGFTGAVVQFYSERTTSGNYTLDYKTARKTVSLEAAATAKKDFPVRTTARYVRVWGRAAGIQPDLAEIKIQGANTDAGIPTNWVRETSAKAEGVGLAAAYMPLLKDSVVTKGSAYGTWTGAVATMTRLGVDLGQPRYIDVVDVYGIVDNAAVKNFPSQKLVIADEPLSTSTTFAALRARGDVRVFDLQAGVNQTVAVGQTARYVAVVKPEGVALAMVVGELNVMGGSTPPASKGNLARAPSTTISSSGAAAGTSATAAADGVTDPMFSRRAGFSSQDAASSAYLDFDTGSTNWIDSLRLFERQPETPRVNDTCTPVGEDPTTSRPYTHCQYFAYTGAPFAFTAPWSASYQLKMWGAGGGPGYTGGVTGGHGGFSTGSVELSGGQNLELGVGEGGKYNSKVATYGGGGKGQGPYGNSGGGMSWARLGSEYLLIAGGGGSAAGLSNGDGGSGGDETAFDGGMTTGTYQPTFYASLCSISAGKGGSQDQGGAQGSPASDSTAGSRGRGGDAAYRNNLGRTGGGGGGYFGGGGGDGATNSHANCAGGAGGGGSSYAAPSVTDVSLESRQVRDGIDRGAIVAPPGDQDPHYDLVAGAAEGHTNRLAGGNGLVVVQWTDPAPVRNSFEDLVVLVSETPFESADTATAMAQPGVTTYPISDLDGSGLLQVDRLGRYVRIASSRPAALDKVELAEAQIWGSPAAVFDGSISLDSSGVRLDGTITSVCPGSAGFISFGVSTRGASFDDLDVDVAGTIAGQCKIGGVSIDGAALEGRVKVRDGKVSFEGDLLLEVNGSITRVAITIGDDGIGVTGNSQVPCLSGSVSVDLAAAFNGAGGSSGALVGVVSPGGCVLTDGISLAPGDSVRGTLTQAPGGALSLDLSAAVVIDSEWLPGDDAEWSAEVNLVQGPNGFTTNIELTSTAGHFQGTINPDGTFSLEGELNIDVSGSNIAVEATIVKDTPDGEPRVDIGGAIDITQNGVHLVGTLVVTGNTATIDATASIECKPGSIDFEVSGVIPLDDDWALDVSAAIPSGGCRINPDVLLSSGTIGGTVGFSGGELTVNLDGEVDIQTTNGLIPGANSFHGTFAIDTVGDEVIGSVALTGNGVKVGGTISWTDDMNWTVSAGGFVTIKGARVDFTGLVRMVRGRASYTASGAIRGPIQLADNVWLLNGSATAVGSGNSLTAWFNGQVRIACTSGDLYANANGVISSNENWTVQFSVTGRGCRFGQNLTLDGNVASGKLTSVNGKVNGTIDAHVTRWEPMGGVVISNVNLHLEIIDGFRFKGNVSAYAQVTLTVMILFIPCTKTLGAQIDANFDIDRRMSGRVGVRVSNISINALSLPFQASLELRLRNGTISGLTLGL